MTVPQPNPTPEQDRALRRDPIAVARVQLVAPTGPADLRARRRLDELEAVIDRGIASFIEVGEALTEVRESKLYRLTHGTFEAYLEDRWNLSRSRGNQLMDAAAVSTVVDIANEAQARELVPVLRAKGPEAVREVFKKVIVQTDGKPTAEAIRVIVAGPVEPTAKGGDERPDRPRPGWSESAPKWVHRVTRWYLDATAGYIARTPGLAEMYGPAHALLREALRPIQIHALELELGAVTRKLERLAARREASSSPIHERPWSDETSVQYRIAELNRMLARLRDVQQ